MKQFLAIYCATAETLAKWNSSMTPEDGKKEMEEWMKWQEANKEAIVQPGNPTGKNTRLTKDGSEDKSNEICGYTVIQAEDKEAAAKIMSGNPHLKPEGTYLELMEIMEM